MSKEKFKLVRKESSCSMDPDNLYDDQGGIIGSLWKFVYARKEEGRERKKDRELIFEIYIRNHSPSWATADWRSEYTDQQLEDCFGMRADYRGYYIEINVEIATNSIDNQCLLHAEKFIGPFETYDDAFYEMRHLTCKEYANLSEKELYSYYELHGTEEHPNFAKYRFPLINPRPKSFLDEDIEIKL